MWSLLGYVFGFGIGVTVLIGFVYLFLLQIPGLLHLIIWLVILAVLTIFALGSYLLLKLSYTWEEDDIHSMTEVKTMRGVSYTGFVITFLYICLVLVMRKRIMLAIGIVKRTARALLTMPTLLFVPVIQSMGNALFLVPWAIYVFCLASSGEMQNKTNSYTLNGQTITYEYRTFEYTNNTKYAFLYLLFCWFWTSEFIVALGQIIISLAFSLWYFTRDKSQRGLVSVSWVRSFSMYLIFILS
jgi:choline transporter-like protein 2/4/5